jgi:hypothetical protein
MEAHIHLSGQFVAVVSIDFPRKEKNCIRIKASCRSIMEARVLTATGLAPFADENNKITADKKAIRSAGEINSAHHHGPSSFKSQA